MPFLVLQRAKTVLAVVLQAQANGKPFALLGAETLAKAISQKTSRFS